MAHREKYVAVTKKIGGTAPTQTVIDPVCRTKLKKAEAKHVLFRSSADVYFCSRHCLDRFVREGFKITAGNSAA